jgi:hypothetical protein
MGPLAVNESELRAKKASPFMKILYSNVTIHLSVFDQPPSKSKD